MFPMFLLMFILHHDSVKEKSCFKMYIKKNIFRTIHKKTFCTALYCEFFFRYLYHTIVLAGIIHLISQLKAMIFFYSMI